MIIDEYQNANSIYAPYLSFKSKAHEKLNEEYIKSFVKNFFEYKNINSYEELDKDYIITDKDFTDITNFKIYYIYEHIIGSISKGEDGKIIHKIRYAVTFDKDLTPNNENEIFYGEIKLGNKPVFYYIYVDLQDMLRFLKQHV